MSYFMIITADAPDIKGIEGIKLVSAVNAHEYIVNIIQQFDPDEAIKMYFVDDGSSTSHDLVNEAQDSLMLGHTFQKTRLSRFLKACFKVNCKIRIWWANDDPNAHKKVKRFTDKKLFIDTLTSKLKQGEDVYLLYEP
jgi:hypothetical protein